MTDESTLDRYRRKMGFDEAVKVTHPADCSPDSCSLVGFKQDGELRYQEQTGTYPVVDEETPDWNPRGCSRQCSYTDATYGDERIRQPMRQTGERGSDGWEPISWEEAYEEIASAVVDATQDDPRSIVTEVTPGEGGLTYGSIPFNTLVNQLGGVSLDGGALISDFDTGQYITFGKFNHGSTHDDWFKSELLLVWHANPAYSRNPSYHFLSEARYDGADVVTIAPDHSPSAVHADRYVPVEPASDAALALGMCRVIVEEDLMHGDFVREQTDLPLLVRDDNERFLRESDLEPDGSDERFYWYDRAAEEVAQSPRSTLALDGAEPALEGSFEVELPDGDVVTVRPVFELLRERLERYDPATVEEVTGIAPSVVEELARDVATNRTTVLNSYNQCKIFHGDLIVRSIALLLALTGNWGAPGRGGLRCWSLVGEVGAMAEMIEPDPMLAPAIHEVADHELNQEELAMEWYRVLNQLTGQVVPPVFWWYNHCGYDEEWDGLELDGVPRTLDDYLAEAREEGWWEGYEAPPPDVDPSVAFWVATNPVRRTRGGTRVMMEELWPTLDTIVTVDYRWSETALYSDIVLPAAFHHEKEQYDSMCDMRVRFWSYADKAIEPRHDSRTEITMIEEIAEAVAAEADDRGLESYDVPQGLTAEKLNDVLDMEQTAMGEIPALPSDLEQVMGIERRYDDLYDRSTFQTGMGELDAGLTHEGIEDYNTAITEGCVDVGLFPDGTDLDGVRDRGYVKYDGPGNSLYGLNTTHDVEPDETVPLFTQHTEDEEVFPTHTGRAQFYLDHDWFLEADEALPRHKDPPAVYGGDRERYPFYVTSGHNRHSTQGVTLTNENQMNQHRGEPHLFINEDAARERGIEDGDDVRVSNDYGSFTVQAKLSSQPAEDQVVIYHAWDQYLYPDGVGTHHVTPGLVKPLHLAGGYGHLEYFLGAWQPQQVDRHTRVDIEPVGDDDEPLQDDRDADDPRSTDT